MATRKPTLEGYQKKIEKLIESMQAKQKKLDGYQKKIDEIEESAKPIREDLKKMELDLANLRNEQIILYMQSHTNQEGLTYYESFTKTIEHQQATGVPAKNTVDKK